MQSSITINGEGCASSALSKTCVFLAAGIFFLLMAGISNAAAPSWWVERGVVSSSLALSDSSAVTEGQLKEFTFEATQEMNADLPAGAGSTLNGLVNGWVTEYQTAGYSGTNPKPSDFQVMTVGQLKHIANLVWPQLVSISYTSATPSWLATTTGSNQAANIGQLKTVFDFDLTTSTDGTGVPSWWEQRFFPGETFSPSTIASFDGLTNLENYQDGINPNVQLQVTVIVK
jgi:hypothetical protein